MSLGEGNLHSEGLCAVCSSWPMGQATWGHNQLSASFCVLCPREHEPSHQTPYVARPGWPTQPLTPSRLRREAKGHGTKWHGRQAQTTGGGRRASPQHSPSSQPVPRAHASTHVRLVGGKGSPATAVSSSFRGRAFSGSPSPVLPGQAAIPCDS